MATDPRCPDCGVTMEGVDVRTGGGYELSVQTDEKREGLLGSLGMNESLDVSPRLCPECGLVRLYADL
ncbi:hypothetical protein [Halorussus marinus]|uniref:hypothetical protein n=1 Tax=Halorussus marinus TaxID=2505976 RepID=UPI00106E0F70|nr:hypothetical protein [Halorussus marinus]